jgi:deoxyribose-phosphate aldolase
MKLRVRELARMMDLSAVRTDVDLAEVGRLATAALKYRCACAFVLPCYLPELVIRFHGHPDVGAGGVVGFPSGAHTRAMKVAEAREALAAGAAELDMVLNVGYLRSGLNARVLDEIRAVVEAAGHVPVKVILEAHHLNDEEIVRGSRLAVRAGAAYVKTGTGWAPTGATLHNVRLIKSTVGDAARVKAAGGIRDLQTVVEMIRLGVSRFGVGLVTGVKILEECGALPDGIEV